MPNSNKIERVAIVGAGGNCGKFITEALLQLGKHQVRAITRMGSVTVLPRNVDVVPVDYSDQASLVEALRGQDALIITLSALAPDDQERKLIEAAADAQVPWILPNDWSPDTSDEQFSREILVGPKKAEIRAYIEKLGQSSWIAVATGFWYEWSLSLKFAYGFDFHERLVTMFDDGKTRVNTSTWPQVGRAVAGLLDLKIRPDSEEDKSPCLQQYRNSWLYVSSFLVSQKDMLDSVLRVTNTSLKDWTVVYEASKDRYFAGLEAMKTGDRSGFGKALYSRVFFPDGYGNYEERKGLANDVLGLPAEDIDEYTQVAIDRATNTKLGG